MAKERELPPEGFVDVDIIWNNDRPYLKFVYSNGSIKIESCDDIIREYLPPFNERFMYPL